MREVDVFLWRPGAGAGAVKEEPGAAGGGAGGGGGDGGGGGPPASRELYLLQYPLRPPWRPYGMEGCASARLKPRQGRVELEVPLPSAGDATGKSLLGEGGGQGDGEGGGGGPRTLELKSSGVPLRSHFVCGTMRGGDLFVSPVGRAVQMRPRLPAGQSDAGVGGAEEGAACGRRGVGADGAAEPPPASAEEVTPIQTMVRKRETERQQELRLQSHAYLVQREQEEPWESLTPHGQESKEAQQMRQEWCTPTESGASFSQTHLQYIDTLVPIPRESLWPDSQDSLEDTTMEDLE